MNILLPWALLAAVSTEPPAPGPGTDVAGGSTAGPTPLQAAAEEPAQPDGVDPTKAEPTEPEPTEPEAEPDTGANTEEKSASEEAPTETDEGASENATEAESAEDSDSAPSATPTSGAAPKEGPPAGTDATPAGAGAQKTAEPTAGEPAESPPKDASKAADDDFTVEVGLGGKKGKGDPTEDKNQDTLNAAIAGQQPNPFGLSLNASGTLTVGQGTFIRDDFVRNELVLWTASLAPAYMLEDMTRLSVSGSLTQELSDSDSTTTPQQLLWSDIGLGVSRPMHRFASTGTILIAAAGATLPTSIGSQAQDLITATSLSARVIQPIDSVFLSYGMSFRKNFHERSSPSIDCDRVQDGQCFVNGSSVPVAFARTGGNELVESGSISDGGQQTSFTWSNGISAMWMASPKISAMASYSLGYSYTYDSFAKDGLSGVGAKGGRGVRPSSSALLGANYLVLPNVSLGGGVRTASGLFDSDGRTLRFPFYEFEAAASNLSQFYLTATLTEQIPL